jgi:hypothetical protein
MAEIELEPVERMRVTILMDNVTDPLYSPTKARPAALDGQRHSPRTRRMFPLSLLQRAAFPMR